MMNRPKLEIFSWAAGIVSAVIALLAFVLQLNGVLPSFTTAQAEKSDEIQKSFDTVLKINDLDLRDSELAKLSAKAQMVDDVPLARKIVGSIHKQVKRDEHIKRLVCRTAQKLGKSSAEELISMITDATTRDSALITLTEVIDPQKLSGKSSLFSEPSKKIIIACAVLVD
jgi:hypothetical protein